MCFDSLFFLRRVAALCPIRRPPCGYDSPVHVKNAIMTKQRGSILHRKCRHKMPHVYYQYVTRGIFSRVDFRYPHNVVLLLYHGVHLNLASVGPWRDQ